MSPVPLPRGICAVCGRESALNGDGTVRWHRPVKPLPGREHEKCHGSGDLPKAAAS